MVERREGGLNGTTPTKAIFDAPAPRIKAGNDLPTQQEVSSPDTKSAPIDTATEKASSPIPDAAIVFLYEGKPVYQMAGGAGDETDEVTVATREELHQAAKPLDSGSPAKSTRDKMLELLQQHRDSNPAMGVDLTDLGKKLNRTRERARQLYNKLSAEYDLPPVAARMTRLQQFSPEETALLDMEIRLLERRRLDTQQIADAIGISPKIAGQFVRQHTKEKRRVFVDQVRALRLQGLSETKIMEALGETKSRVESALKQLKKSHAVPRLRNARRTPEGMAAFEAQVKQLQKKRLSKLAAAQDVIPASPIKVAQRQTPASSHDAEIIALREEGLLADKQIAEQLKISLSKLNSRIQKLLKSGEIKKKSVRARGPNAKTRALIPLVEALMGLPYAEIAKQLNISYAKLVKVASYIPQAEQPHEAAKPLDINSRQEMSLAHGEKSMKVAAGVQAGKTRREAAQTPPAPEQLGEIEKFGDEERRALLKDGAYIYLLEETTIAAQIETQKRKRMPSIAGGVYGVYGQEEELPAAPSRRYEVAIYPAPTRLFVEGTAGQDLDEQERLVQADAQSLRERLGVEGIGEIIPDEASTLTELTFKHYDRTGEWLFGPKYGQSYQTREDILRGTYHSGLTPPDAISGTGWGIFYGRTKEPCFDGVFCVGAASPYAGYRDRNDLSKMRLNGVKINGIKGRHRNVLAVRLVVPRPKAQQQTPQEIAA